VVRNKGVVAAEALPVVQNIEFMVEPPHYFDTSEFSAIPQPRVSVMGAYNDLYT